MKYTLLCPAYLPFAGTKVKLILLAFPIALRRHTKLSPTVLDNTGAMYHDVRCSMYCGALTRRTREMKRNTGKYETLVCVNMTFGHDEFMKRERNSGRSFIELSSCRVGIPYFGKIIVRTLEIFWESLLRLQSIHAYGAKPLTIKKSHCFV